MYTGTVINDLLEMVARAEGHAEDRRTAVELEHEDRLLASHFGYRLADAQPMMNGVA
ncbi:MAG: hypothetical protein LAN70_10860 [Acidobacteriia bacterium]|nr:hypothetical protein [Terriglobia bacterium]